jgi:hypothetical protein
LLLPSFTPTPGTHTFRAYTRNPNGSTDQRPTNDTSTLTFTVAPGLTLPYFESFTNLPFPPNNGSVVINPDGPAAQNTGITWARTTLAGNPGTQSMRINLYNYQTVGQRDIYRTPKVDVGGLDSIVLTFNVAYRQYFGTDVTTPPNDSLRVLISPDCGVSWLPTSYAKGGAGLATVPTTTDSSFVPRGTTQWRSERVVLKDFCAQNLNNVMIGFESYNDFGNNLYIDGINVAGFASVNRNSEMKSISNPLSALCTPGFSPKITFGNAGLDALTSLKINYQIDNGPVTTFNWTGNMSKCDSTTLTLASTTTTTGTHVLTVFTSEPNGLSDQELSNDTLRKTFAVYEAAAAPLFEGFEESTFPRANWGVQNVNGGTTWDRNSNPRNARTGNGSMFINNPNAANSNNALDYFISPIVINSASFDSMYVDFDLAYRAGNQYPGSTVFPLDTLEILATSDCGATFTPVWKKFGNELQTVNDPNYTYTDVFSPVRAAEWKRFRVYLTPFVGSSNFQLYFASRGNKQNNIWLDNINIYSQTLPRRLKDQGYLIYPNPFNNSFLIHHSAVEPPVDLQSAQVYNAAGQLVWDKRYNGNADRQITVDLGNKANGVYVLKLIYTNKTVIERIVKH